LPLESTAPCAPRTGVVREPARFPKLALYNVAGETSELSLEPAIEGQFDGSRCVVPSGVAKSMLTPFSGANHSTRIVVVLSAQGRTVRGLA
jgi:hypothetical protein